MFLNLVFWSTWCLCDQLDNYPDASGGGQMHTSILPFNCLECLWYMHFCGSPSRYMTVGYLIFSRLCLQSEGNREALVNSAGGELWVLEYVSWLKKKYEVGDHQLVNVLENQRDTPEEKHVSVRGNFRSVRLDQDKATTAPCKSVMSELSHLVTIYPVPTWPKEWRSREGERRNLEKWTHLYFLVGSLGLSRGEGDIE